MTAESDPADPRPRPGRRRVAAVAVTAVVVSSVSWAVVTATAPGARAAELTPFDSCEALQGWYARAAEDQIDAIAPGGYVTTQAARDAVAVPEAAAADQVAGAAAPAAAAGSSADAAGSPAGAVGSSGTGTNVQEAGVDEPSALKTDGRLAFAVAGDDLVVTAIDGPAPEVLGRVAVTESDPQDPMGLDRSSGAELLLAGDRVLVLLPSYLPVAIEGGTAGDARIANSSMIGWSGPSTTVLVLVDVSDPAAPVVLARDEVEGGYLSARSTGDADAASVRLVLSSRPAALEQAFQAGYEGAYEEGDDGADNGPVGTVDEGSARSRARQVIRSAQAQDWLPQRVVREGISATREPLLACDQVSRPRDPSGLGTLTVLTLDPTTTPGDGLVVDVDAVVADGDNVYAATDRLYVATTRGGWGSGFGPAGATRTELHGFDTSDPRRTTYLGSGAVDGWLLGRWALDAEGGTLRVATTSDGPSPESLTGSDPGAVPPIVSSSVVVLAERDGGLAEIGRLDGLGPTESIRAVRWFADTAVVVTFRQTDPLYVIDLADPTAPRVRGELKVTGYSGYLHPLGDGLLLGVGQEADEFGGTTGTKAETFDLAGDAPASLGSLVWPQSSSPVEWDSRRFSYLPQRRTAILGIDFYSYGEVFGDSGVAPLPPAPDGTPGSTPGEEVDPVGPVEVTEPEQPMKPLPLAGPNGPGLVAVTLGEDGSIAESGRWLAVSRQDTLSWADITAQVVTEDLVAVVSTSYDIDGRAVRSLVVLDVDGLAVRGAVPLSA